MAGLPEIGIVETWPLPSFVRDVREDSARAPEADLERVATLEQALHVEGGDVDDADLRVERQPVVGDRRLRDAERAREVRERELTELRRDRDRRIVRNDARLERGRDVDRPDGSARRDRGTLIRDAGEGRPQLLDDHFADRMRVQQLRPKRDVRSVDDGQDRRDTRRQNPHRRERRRPALRLSNPQRRAPRRRQPQRS
jgi:hypothetical protein